MGALDSLDVRAASRTFCSTHTPTEMASELKSRATVPYDWFGEPSR